MPKQNCWEYKNCGRQQGGPKTGELGVCGASSERRANGINGGRNGGRACWAIAGTLCGGKVQGSFASKVINCMKCEFYQLVGAEEGPNHQSAKEIIAALR
jgi:hypothetical protein